MIDDRSARHNGKAFAEWQKEWEMEDRYNFHTIESKWQKIWDWMVRKKYFHQFLAIEPLIFSRK